MNLSNTQLFRGLEEAEITSLLDCLNATTRSFQKGEVILSEGNTTENIGIVLSGLAVISCNDIWGNTSILGHVAPLYSPRCMPAFRGSRCWLQCPLWRIPPYCL